MSSSVHLLSRLHHSITISSFQHLSSHISVTYITRLKQVSIDATTPQSSEFHWPAELRSVWPRNLEQSTSFTTSPRTVAEHLQAPAEDSAFPACVNHHPAPLWLNSEFGAAYKYLDSTQRPNDAYTVIALTHWYTYDLDLWPWKPYQ